MPARLCLVLLVPALMLVSACGGDGDSSSSTAGASEGPPPANLVGTYSTTLKPSDLPAHPPPELTGGSAEWTLKIADKGGANNGPVLVIANANDRFGTLEGSTLSVAGNKLFLHKEECANKAGTSYTFGESQYSWALNGKTLHLSDGKGYCPDKVALTILTAEPWTKEG